MCTSSGTGRTEGRKLKRPTFFMASQSARSRALAKAVERPTTRTLWSDEWGEGYDTEFLGKIVEECKVRINWRCKRELLKTAFLLVEILFTQLFVF